MATSAYSAVGYVHYKHMTDDERLAAQRVERANADLQHSLDGMRNELAGLQTRIDTAGEKPERQIAVSEEGKDDDRITALMMALEKAEYDLQLRDAERANLAARLSHEITDVEPKPRAQSSLDQDRQIIQQLSAERDEATGEMGHLRARSNELEKKLTLLQARQSPHTINGIAPAPIAPSEQALETAAPVTQSALARTMVISAAPILEQARQVASIAVKNFLPPASVPNYFSNESGPILGDPTPVPPESVNRQQALEPVSPKLQAAEPSAPPTVARQSRSPQRVVRHRVNHQARSRPLHAGKVRF